MILLQKHHVAALVAVFFFSNAATLSAVRYYDKRKATIQESEKVSENRDTGASTQESLLLGRVEPTVDANNHLLDVRWSEVVSEAYSRLPRK